jgi:hypothetical protein
MEPGSLGDGGCAEVRRPYRLHPMVISSRKTNLAPSSRPKGSGAGNTKSVQVLISRLPRQRGEMLICQDHQLKHAKHLIRPLPETFYSVLLRAIDFLFWMAHGSILDRIFTSVPRDTIIPQGWVRTSALMQNSCVFLKSPATPNQFVPLLAAACRC